MIAAKEELSFVTDSVIRLDYKGKTYSRGINRELLDRLIAPIIERTLEPCRACLNDVKLTAEQIQESGDGRRFYAHPAGTSGGGTAVLKRSRIRI